MNKKRQSLLSQVIEEYLKNKQPIGSQTLKDSNKIKMSSATIRNHFKMMMQEGLLIQTHISSGRIPTHLAFKLYWQEQINLEENTIFSNISVLQKKSEEIGCFIGVYYPSQIKLLQVSQVEDFLILSFDGNREIILRASDPLKRFVQDLIGIDLEDMRSFCLQVQAKDLFQSLKTLVQNDYVFSGAKHITPFMQTQRGEKLFFELCEGKIFHRLGNGIYFDHEFPRGYLARIFETQIEEKKARVIYCGELEKNFNLIKE